MATSNTNVRSEKIRIRLKAYDHVVLEQSAEKIVDTAKKTGAKVSGPIPLPTEKEIVTIIRSPHKHKDSRERITVTTSFLVGSGIGPETFAPVLLAVSTIFSADWSKTTLS